MELDYSDKICAFDTLYTSNQIQMLKIMVPYTHVSMRKNLAILIKYLEFQYMMQLPSHAFTGNWKEVNTLDTAALLAELRPHCSQAMQQQLDQFSNMLNSMELFGQMQEMMQFMGDFTSNDGTSDGANNLGGLGNLFGNLDLSSMLSPEQMALFELFKTTSEPDP